MCTAPPPAAGALRVHIQVYACPRRALRQQATAQALMPPEA